MIVGRKISVQAATALLAAFAAVVLLAAVPSGAAATPSYAWVSQGHGGSGEVSATGVSALPDGSSIITGDFNGTATFGATILKSPGLINSVFTAKVNANGSYAWATQSGGGTGRDSAMARGVSALPDGSSIITGQFNGTATFGTTTLTSTGSVDVFTAKVNADGSYGWAIKAGGTGDAQARGVSALPDGSSIITGDFTVTATFGATTLTSTGAIDTFTAKVNADGSYGWATQSGGGTSDENYAIGLGVSALPDGSSIITGQFNSTATFGATTLTSTGAIDIFTAKVNADGSYAWATKAGGGTGDDSPSGVSALPDGSSIITGQFNDTATFGVTTLTSTGSVDTFTAKVNADGSYAWATKAGGPGTDFASGVSALPDGSSIITGQFGGTVTFGATTLKSPRSGAVFTAQLNADGSYGWAIKAGGTGMFDAAGATGVSALADGSSIITGYFSGTATFGATTLTNKREYVDTFTARILAKGPSNHFTIRSVKVGVKALTSTVVIPGRGTLTQRVTRSSTAAAVLTVCKTRGKATKAGTVKLTCKLSAATRAALRKRSLRVSVKTTFTPTGGLPASKTQAVTLKSQRPPPYTG